jgi:hypothetical protein
LYLEHPILQRRIKTSEGLRTIAGLGTWEGWICSSEMDNAVKYGYSFKILHGYQFEQGDLFSGYVNKMYNLRLTYPKSDPMNQIAKLLQNSLYGKFGMRTEITKVGLYSLIDKEDRTNLRELLDIYGNSVQDVVKFDGKVLIVRDASDKLLDEGDELSTELYHGSEVNIAIASFVTASARIHMSIFKNNPDYKLYYSDTDSIIIDSPLPSDMIGSALGLMKLEYVVKRAVFLAPKVYGLVTKDGEEVIKVKGLTPESLSNVNVNTLSNLLIQDSSKSFIQEKWYNNLVAGTISVSDIAYTLKVTSNKREAIYIDGVYEKTTPYHYDEIKFLYILGSKR